MTARRGIRPDRKAERGFALLIVLWSLVFLSFLATRLVASAHSEAQIVANLEQAERLRLQADGAVFEAAFRVLDHGGRHWVPDGAWHSVRSGDLRLAVRVADEADKVNLNTAPAPLLASLLRLCGATPEQAQTLSTAILIWRGEAGDNPEAAARLRAAEAARYRAAGLTYVPPNAPLRSAGELRLVAGMSAGLLARLEPHLTVHSTYGPRPDTPDSLVRAAIAEARASGSAMPDDMNAGEGLVIEVIAHASTGAGGSFTRRAVLRLDPASAGHPSVVLAWGQDPGAVPPGQGGA